jgi:hypothetical protein
MYLRSRSSEDHHAGLRQLRSKHTRDSAAADGRHVLIEQCDVGAQRTEKLQREIAIVRLGHDLDAWVTSEARA